MKNTIQLPVNPVTLRFNKDHRFIEKEYQAFIFQYNLSHIRLCHYLAILFYAPLLFVDLQVAPENAIAFWVTRLAVVCPFFLVGIVLTYLRWYHHIYNYMLGFYVILTAGGNIAMACYAPPTYHFVYFLGILGCLIFGYTFIRLPFLHATVSGWIVATMYWFGQLTFDGYGSTETLAYIIYLLCFEFLFMIICYTWEKANRNGFYLYHLLGIEQGKSKKMNAELTDVLEKRTIELEQLADALKKIKTLNGLLPICTACKKIRDDSGYWKQIEIYIREHSDADFSHSLCPECAKALYPDLFKVDN